MMYYYIGPNNQQLGPVPADQLVSRGVTGETMVWAAGMAQWQRAKDVPELKQFLGGSSANSFGDQSTQFNSPPPNYGNNGNYGNFVNSGNAGNYGNYGNYGPQYAGQFGGAQPMGPKPDSNLVWGILTTILCCLPFGVVSIVYASKVDSAWRLGQQEEAEDYSNKAKNWALASALTSLAVLVIYIIIIVATGASLGAFS